MRPELLWLLGKASPLCRLWWALLLLAHLAPGQTRPQAWYFGSRAAVIFSGSAPARVDLSSVMRTPEACASPCDSTGALLFYSNGEQVWDRTHELMPPALPLGGHSSATQGVTVLASPYVSGRYYLFLPDAIERQLAQGLRYAVVDMHRRGGLGEVTASNLPLPLPAPAAKLSEHLALLRHANGVDTWVVVHGWDSNIFYSFLVSAQGVESSPVVSTVGPVLNDSPYLNSTNNAAGFLKGSPAGDRLVMSVINRGLTLYAFDNATGHIAAPLPLVVPRGTENTFYGVEFSPTGSRLYASVSSPSSHRLLQYNLQAGSPAAVAQSGQVVGGGASFLGIRALQLAPDGKLYVSDGDYLATIEQPERVGAACNYRAQALFLAGRGSGFGLPNQPPDTRSPPGIDFTSTSACEGTLTAFQARVPAWPAGSYTLHWAFGDPASGAANTATGPAATHRFAGGAGSYEVTLTATRTQGPGPYTSSRTVTITPVPGVDLGARQQGLCPGGVLSLQPILPLAPGSRLRWQDGSSGPSLAVRTPGWYWLEVTSAAGCVARDSVQVELAAQPAYTLGADTLVCLEQPLTLRLRPAPSGATLRWSGGATSPTVAVTRPGTYWVDITQQGCGQRVSVTVRSGGACPVRLPTVITPNGDGLNDTFQAAGLYAPAWRLQVFNRWGRRVFAQEHYDNGWGGQAGTAGTYYYLLTNSVTGEHYKGVVQVLP